MNFCRYFPIFTSWIRMHIECGSGSRREKMLSLMEPEGLGVKTVVATLQTKLKNYIFVFKCVLESWTINQAYNCT